VQFEVCAERATKDSLGIPQSGSGEFHRPVQIERCAVQIAKSFKAQSPPLSLVPIKQNLGEFDITPMLRERGAAQRPLVELQWNLHDGVT
jgi:hypothetical protein